jgi:hypothetical protein
VSSGGHAIRAGSTVRRAGSPIPMHGELRDLRNRKGRGVVAVKMAESLPRGPDDGVFPEAGVTSQRS